MARHVGPVDPGKHRDAVQHWSNVAAAVKVHANWRCSDLLLDRP